ncbi:MAG: cytochrome c3 family protein, partial [Boseongicola sp.]
SSTVTEIGVGCESCHGPAEAHLRLVEDSADPLFQSWAGLSAQGFVVDLSLGGDTLIDQCAGCHSRREPFEGGNPLPGTPFHDAYRLSTLREGLYHADGQILDEVYVYGSFLQSKMYENGVTCSNCHDPHSAELKAEGNAVCTQCHSPAGNPEFASLPLKSYDDPSHHHHESGSTGAQCKSCHMSERNFMVIDGRRDHSFRIPRPDLSLQTRSPNVCNDCHDEQSASWAASAVEQWYPDSDKRGPTFSQTFAAARNDLSDNIEGLVVIAEHTEFPAIVRATALEMLVSEANPQLATRLEPLLSDPDPLVRENAIGVQRGAPETERSARLVGLLADPVRSVRIAAVRNFLGMRIARMPDRMAQDLNTAMAEWQNSLLAKADFPETQLVLAGIGLTTRNMAAALQAFGEAVALDPQLTQAWVMMIRIHGALGDMDAALDTADQAIAANPDDVQLHLLKADLSR